MSENHNSQIEKASIKIQGVTYYNRQDNLKSLFDQHLQKEDKHLSLEKYYVGNLQTFCVVFNGLEVGYIPDEFLYRFLSKQYDYELTNIHIGTIKDEKGKDIYFARLYVTFTNHCKPVENPIDQETIAHLTNQLEETKHKLNETSSELDETKLTLIKYKLALDDAGKQNKVLQEEINKLKNKPLNEQQINKQQAIKPKIKQETTSYNKNDESQIKNGCVNILIILSCIVVFIISISFAFTKSLWYLIATALCIAGIIIAIKELKGS